MKQKNCKNCNFCKRLYRKFLYKFWKDNLYYCSCNEKIIDNNSYCENWHKKEIKYDISKQRFDDIENDINIVFENLKEK